MNKLANYLGISVEQLEELDIDILEDTGSSGEMVYSFWFEVPEDISEKLIEITGWEPGQVISGIPINVLEGDALLEFSGLDKLLTDLFSSDANPFAALESKIEEYRELVLEHDNKDTGQTLKSVLFAASISSLETYLWEIVRWKIDNDSSAINGIIRSCPQYGSTSFSLVDIVSDGFSAKKQVLLALDNIVWHRVEKIAPIFTKGLDVKLPSLKFFHEAINVRHHIVHRSGKDKEGNIVAPSLVEVTGLMDNILKFARKLNKQIYKVRVTGVATNTWI